MQIYYKLGIPHVPDVTLNMNCLLHSLQHAVDLVLFFCEQHLNAAAAASLGSGSGGGGGGSSSSKITATLGIKLESHETTAEAIAAWSGGVVTQGCVRAEEQSSRGAEQGWLRRR